MMVHLPIMTMALLFSDPVQFFPLEGRPQFSRSGLRVYTFALPSPGRPSNAQLGTCLRCHQQHPHQSLLA